MVWLKTEIIDDLSAQLNQFSNMCGGILAVGMVWFKTKIIDDLSAQLNLYSNMWWGILAVGMVWLQFSYDISDESYTNLITILSFSMTLSFFL